MSVSPQGRYNAKTHNHASKVSVLLENLSNKGLRPSKVILIRAIQQAAPQSKWDSEWMSWDAFVAEGQNAKLGRTASGEIEWCRLPFDAPLWILFSSGTTGRPKCEFRFIRFNTHGNLTGIRPIVHRAGGMLLQSKKEFTICADLQPQDVFFYYTTT